MVCVETPVPNQTGLTNPPMPPSVLLLPWGKIQSWCTFYFLFKALYPPPPPFLLQSFLFQSFPPCTRPLLIGKRVLRIPRYEGGPAGLQWQIPNTGQPSLRKPKPVFVSPMKPRQQYAVSKSSLGGSTRADTGRHGSLDGG